MTGAGVGMASSEIITSDVPGGPSTSQTIMVSSLQRLLAIVPSDSPPASYRAAVMDENVLGKQTVSGREWAFRQLRRFYALNPQSLLFRALRDLWDHDKAGQPLLAMLCALARDPVLRASAAVIVTTEPGEVITSGDFEAVIEAKFAGAYKEITRRTTAQKVASSWDQSGHLHQERPGGRSTRAFSTPTAVTYALILGYLECARGQSLFKTLWTSVLDQPVSQLMDLTATASQAGLLEFRSAGGTPALATAHDRERDSRPSGWSGVCRPLRRRELRSAYGG